MEGKVHSCNQKKEDSLMIRNDLQICRQGVHNNANTDLLSFSLKTLTRKITKVVAMEGSGERIVPNTKDSEDM